MPGQGAAEDGYLLISKWLAFEPESSVSRKDTFGPNFK